ncbi:MAG: imidazole glycerol phosphate synthase subunit HisH [Corynebacterium sp.]|nr:imidazole glycerol phosphate synthase subunit HisH [Corynebacterium sp.]
MNSFTWTTTPHIALLDYGAGNLYSAANALTQAGAHVTVTRDRDEVAAADGLVVPGVGAYAACMESLSTVGGTEMIWERIERGAPVLGICLGLQLMFEHGLENGVDTTGVGYWPGVVESLNTAPLPHMGWNTVDIPEGSRYFAGVSATDRVYFVHSYGALSFTARSGGEDALVTWAEHGGVRFVAAIEDGPVWASQFHPEKSGAVGLRLLHNWLTHVVEGVQQRA